MTIDETKAVVANTIGHALQKEPIIWGLILLLALQLGLMVYGFRNVQNEIVRVANNCINLALEGERHDHN